MSDHTEGKLIADGTLVFFGGNRITGGFDLRCCPRPEENARRIAACWNACEGMETSRLDDPWHPEDGRLLTRHEVEVWRENSGRHGMRKRVADQASIAAELLGTLEAAYEFFGANNNQWPGRHGGAGQALLSDMCSKIAAATGRAERDVQDDYCNRWPRSAGTSEIPRGSIAGSEEFPGADHP